MPTRLSSASRLPASIGLRPIARSLRRAPEFVFPLVGLLALGVAIAIVSFDTIYARLLQPLPFPEPHRIVSLREAGPDGKPRNVALANLADWRTRTHAFDEMAAYRVQSMAFLPSGAAAGDARIVQVAMVTPEFFRVLGVSPQGRPFTDDEARRNEPVAIVSRSVAEQMRAGGGPFPAAPTVSAPAASTAAPASGARLASAPQTSAPPGSAPPASASSPSASASASQAVVPSASARPPAGAAASSAASPDGANPSAATSSAAGVGITMNGRAYSVIGEVPDALFAIQGRVPDVFIPLDPARYGQSHDQRTLEAIARLAGDVREETAAVELAGAAAALALDRPATNRGFSATLLPLDDYLRGSQRTPLLLLALGAALVFGIIALNAANLLLVRSVARRAEFALRVALGATMPRIWMEALIESLLLGLAALIAGRLAAPLLTALIDLVIPPLVDQPLLPAAAGGSLSLLSGLAFNAALVLALAFVLAMPTLLVARSARLAHVSHRTRGADGVRTLHLLVCGQLAVMVILLLSAGLLMRSFRNVLDVPPGFAPEGVMRFGIGLPEARYATDAQLTDAHERLREALLQQPGIAEAGVAFRLPLGGAPVLGSFQIDTKPLPKGQRPAAAMNVASTGYFETMRIPLIAGRLFSPDDRLARPRVILINEAFRRRYFPEQEAVGRQLALDWASDSHPAGSLWQIVGIVGSTPQATLDRDPQPEIYLSTSQFPLDGGSYVLRTRDGRPIAASVVQAAVAQVDPGLERIRLGTLDTVLQASLGARRRTLIVAGAFALLALIVSGAGLYGSVAFASVRRRAEFAIRLSLGAQRRQIAQIVLKTAIGIVTLALLPGLGLFALFGHLLAHQFYGVEWFDLATWIGVGGVSLSVALLASLPSALRAARVPLISLLRAG